MTAPDFQTCIVRRACWLQAVCAVLLAIFTKTVIYSIIFLFGAAISIVSFMITVKLTDRFIAKKKGKLLFFGAEVGKMILIVLFFVIFSPLRPQSVIGFILGISIINLTVMGDGIAVLYRMWFRHGA